MAVSVAASTVPSLSSDRTTRFASSSSSSSSSSNLSSSSSLQFPVQLRRFRIRTNGVSAPFRHRILPQVSAKKQTFSNFDDLLANCEKPVLVDFYATWCGPCQFMAPILNEVSITLNDKIQVVKIDTEKYPSIADKYGIQALPTFIIFKDGEPYDRFGSLLRLTESAAFHCIAGTVKPEIATLFLGPCSLGVTALAVKHMREYLCTCIDLSNFVKEGALNADQLIERIETALKVKQ